MSANASSESPAPAGAAEVESWYELTLTCEGLQPYAHTTQAFREHHKTTHVRELCNPCVVVEKMTRYRFVPHPVRFN
eukprot:2139176-Pyramimonas_sp.AAC.1